MQILTIWEILLLSLFSYFPSLSLRFPAYSADYVSNFLFFLLQYFFHPFIYEYVIIIMLTSFAQENENY